MTLRWLAITCDAQRLLTKSQMCECMFNLTTGAPHKLHKEFVKMKAVAYYYQPQTQLNDKEVICDDMKGAMTLNVGDDISAFSSGEICTSM